MAEHVAPVVTMSVMLDSASKVDLKLNMTEAVDSEVERLKSDTV